MRGMLVFCLVGFGFACQGCAPLWQSARTSLLQPVINSRVWTEMRECHRNRELAESAWGDYVSKHAGTMECAKDLESGFKQGFADFLYSGGTGAPPPVPPRCYWNYCYETPEGHKAIEAWFAGFRAGAESAKESGYRKLVLVPASTCLPSMAPQTPQLPPPSPSAAPGMLPAPTTSKEEELPVPRQAPNSAGPIIGDPPNLDTLPPPPPVPSRLPGEVSPMLGPASKTME
jgi:hypothetical protein